MWRAAVRSSTCFFGASEAWRLAPQGASASSSGGESGDSRRRIAARVRMSSPLNSLSRLQDPLAGDLNVVDVELLHGRRAAHGLDVQADDRIVLRDPVRGVAQVREPDRGVGPLPG